MRINTRAKLYEIINLSLPGAEIGVASGVFSLEILQWGISKLYMVDVWEESPDIRGMASDPKTPHTQNYLDAKNRVNGYNAVLMKGLSVEMAKEIPDNSLGFIYIDACHYYDHVMADLNAWVPKLVYGGVCGLHDYGERNYDVKQAVHEFAVGKYKIHELIEDGKPENIGAYFIKK